MYLYPTRGSLLPKHSGYPDQRVKIILENEKFSMDWLLMSLPVKDYQWLVDRYDASTLRTKVEVFEARVSSLMCL